MRTCLLAPIESSVIPLPHQILTLLKAVSSDRVRLLLADEVGLGKTIEAGLILKELKLRGLIKRILVVAPKGLVSQWVAEMRTHFGEEFRLLLPGDFPAFRRVSAQDNIWKTFDQVVCPLDAVKPIDNRKGWTREQVAEHNRDRFEDLLSADWDLIVVDEAHRLGGTTDQVARASSLALGWQRQHRISCCSLRRRIRARLMRFTGWCPYWIRLPFRILLLYRARG